MRYFPKFPQNVISICGKFVLGGSILEKCGKIWENGRFSGRLRSDWGYTTRAATAGLGSIGLDMKVIYYHFDTKRTLNTSQVHTDLVLGNDIAWVKCNDMYLRG